MAKTAIILGATGLTGSILLQKLIADNNYTSTKLFSRSLSKVSSNKVVEFIVDLQKPTTFAKDFIADEVFCCIGTTAAKTKDMKQYKAIDFGIPVTAATLAKKNGIPSYLVVSAMGANASSVVFYNKIKGEMEQAILALNIEKTHILRPSLIGGNRTEFRLGERIGQGMMSLLNPLFVGSLQKYKMIHPDAIATCLLKLANSRHQQQIFSSDEIQKLANISIYNE